MDNAAVIGGLGMVGNATRHIFGIDKYIDLKESTTSYKEIGESVRYVFICLPTPTVNGECETKAIKEAISAILDHATEQKVFIIRSTVTPGTSKHLMDIFGINSIVHNPEFLTESTWEDDSNYPDLVVVGAEQSNYADDVIGLYRSRHKGAEMLKTDTITSETIKYAINTFYATKVVFANEMFNVAERIGANYEKIKEAMYKRKWIGKNHLDIWHNGGRGAGGKCLEKDLEAFADFSQSRLLLTANRLNKEILQKYPKYG